MVASEKLNQLVQYSNGYLDLFSGGTRNDRICLLGFLRPNPNGQNNDYFEINEWMNNNCLQIHPTTSPEMNTACNNCKKRSKMPTGFFTLESQWAK